MELLIRGSRCLVSLRLHGLGDLAWGLRLGACGCFGGFSRCGSLGSSRFAGFFELGGCLGSRDDAFAATGLDEALEFRAVGSDGGGLHRP